MKNYIKCGVLFILFFTFFITGYLQANDDLKSQDNKINYNHKNLKIKKETPKSAKEWHKKEQNRRENKKRAEEMRKKQQEANDNIKTK